MEKISIHKPPMTECCSTNTDRFRVSIACVTVCHSKWILELPKALATPHLPLLEKILMMSSSSDIISCRSSEDTFNLC